jgi:multidrug efflux pump subunit AcrB
MTEQQTPDNNNHGNGESGEHENLGIAGNIAKQFINSPVTPLLMVAFLAIGLLGLIFTPRQEDPKISVPMVDIYVQYDGATAEQVSSLVTEPLERIMSELPGIRHVYSATMRGSAIVTVRFKVGEDLGESIVKVHDKLQSNLDKIPPGVSMPLVKPVGIDDVPVVTVTLWAQGSKEGVDDGMLRTLALDILQRLEEVPNTGKGFVVGGSAEQIRVEVSPERLSGYGITMGQVAETIRTANAERSAGNIESGNTSFRVQTGAFLTTADEVARLVVAVRNGAPVYVRDIARVFQGPEETRQTVAYYTGPSYVGEHDADFEPAVTIAIAKKIGTNGVTVARDILAKLESLEATLIPTNVHYSITRDYGKTANDKVNGLLWALFEAAVAVSILCLIGLGLRAASVVITIIPIVILITIWSAWIVDYTIDRVSLFALVFSIGILVDDATVVVENIFRRWLAAGKTTLNIAVDAVREVGNPTILATLTIISALLPMGFVSGLMGPYMRPIPVLGSSAMFFSLVAAFVFAPWFAMRVRPQMDALRKAEEREQKVSDFIGRFYRPCMMLLCRNRLVAYIFLFSLIGTTFLVCSFFYFNIVTVKMLPFDNKPEFNVVLNMPEGTALPVTANLLDQMSQELRKIPEVTEIQTYAGTASPFNFNGMVRHYYLRQHPWEGDIQVMLLDKEKRERGSHDIAVDARHRLNEYIDRAGLAQQGVKIQVVEMPPGPPVLQTLVAEVYGPTADIRRQVTQDLTDMFVEADGVVDVDNYMADEYGYWRFEVDTEKAVRLGVSVDNINQNLTMAMGGYKLGDVKRGIVLEPTYIVMQVPLSTRANINRLLNLPIQTNTGMFVPLAELGRFVQQPEDPIIYHKDLRPVEYVTGEMEGKLGAPLYGMYAVEDLLNQYTAPDGVSISGMKWAGTIGAYGAPPSDDHSDFEWSGEWTVTYETFRDMGAAFIAAMILIYGLIVWEFRNFVLAGLIMAPIPLTMIGIIPGHWITGAEFTATSMIGMIALAGIIVRNSILLVEFVRNEIAEGKDIEEAVMVAGQTRLRPILITALTLMAGSWALLSDPIFQGMAVSLLYGTGVATVLTLVVIPLGCTSVAGQFYAELERGLEDEDEQSTVVRPAPPPETAPASTAPGLPLWLVLWTKIIGALTWVFYIFRAVYIMLRMALDGVMARIRGLFGGGKSTPPPPPSGPSGGTPPTSGGTPPPSGPSGGTPPPALDAGKAEADKPAAKPAAGPSTRLARKTAVKKTAKKKASKKTAKKVSSAPSANGNGETNGNGHTGKRAKRRGIRLKDDLDI